MTHIFSGQTRPSVSKETFDANYERTFGKWSKPMHGNEVKITDKNKDDLMLEAIELGPQYVSALKEQTRRQTAEIEETKANE